MTALYASLLAVQLGFLVALTIGGFLLAGRYVDTRLDSTPAFTVIGILFGLVTTVSEIRHWLLPFLRITHRHDSHRTRT